jgi:hypothetical protein
MEFFSTFKPTSSGTSLKKVVPVLLGTAAFMCIAPAPSAQAAGYTPAFSFNNAPNTLTFSDIYVLGYHFSTDMDREIKAVGIYSSVSDPPNSSFGIWDFTVPQTPNLIYQTVLKNRGDCANDGYCWTPSVDLLDALPKLLKGKNYVIAAAWGAGKPVPAQMNPSDLNIIANGFTIGVNAFSDPLNTLTYTDENLDNYPPTESAIANKKSFFTMNLSFEPSSLVDTPAPLPLIGGAAAFGWSRKIRRRINSST